MIIISSKHSNLSTQTNFMTVTVGSLFAGIGGICQGFKNAGCNIKWANEYNLKACETYEANFKEHNLICRDIHELETNELESVDIITSGFPCQAFSIAGHRKGFDDHRGNLFFETARFIKDLKPKAFFLENVRNLHSHDNGNTFKVIREVIDDQLGYSFIPFVLNAKDYSNIPQTRERIYIIGFKDEAHKSGGLTDNFQPIQEVLLTKTIHDFLEADKPEDKYYYQPEHQYYERLINEVTSTDTLYQWRRVYIRENKNNLCPTLTANMGTGGHNVPIVKDKFGIRKLTPKECINFQGFSKDFEFPKNMANSHCYKQAGNSVVVPVVENIAREMLRLLEA